MDFLTDIGLEEDFSADIRTERDSKISIALVNSDQAVYFTHHQV